MKIEQVTKYRVGSCEFSTEEEAQNFLLQEKNSQDIFSQNLSILNDFVLKNGSTHIPAVDPEGNVKLFYSSHDNDPRNDWKELFGDEMLRYIDWKVKIIDPDQFLEKFCQQSSTMSIDANELSCLISVIKGFINSKQHYTYSSLIKTYSSILDSLGEMRFNPVYLDRD